MTTNKTYTTPVWWMAIIIFIKICLTVLFIIGMQEVKALSDNGYRNEQINRFISKELIIQGIYLALLLAEAITYWKIRQRITRKGPVWGHIAGLLTAFVVLPVALSSFSVLLNMFNDGNISTQFSMINAMLSVMIWVFLIIAHVFFIMVLIDAFKKRPQPEMSAPNGPDILNDYA